MRKDHERRWYRIASVAAIATLLCAVGWGVSGALAANTQQKPVLTVGIVGFYGGGDLYVTGNSYWGAFIKTDHSATPKLSPRLATAWSVTDRNQTITLTFRHDIRYDDGTLFTAQTEKAYLTWIQKTPVYLNGFKSYLDLTGAKVTTFGKWTVRIHLTAPSPLILQEFVGDVGILSYAVEPKCLPHLEAKTNTVDCGAGPYMIDFSQTVVNSKVTLVPNPYYYDKSQQRWRKIVLLDIATASTMLQAVRSHEVDVAQGDPTTAAAAKTTGYFVEGFPELNAGLMLNQEISPPLANLQVRRAMNYALNRKALARAFNTLPTDEVLTRDGVDPNPKYANYYPYNPSKARAMLAAAGYPNGFSMKVLSYGAMGNLGTPLVEAVCSQLAVIGIKCAITEAPNESVWSADAGKGKVYDAMQNNFGSDFMPVYVSILNSPTGLGFPTGPTDPVITRLMAEAATATGNRQISLFRRVTDQWVTQATYLTDVSGEGYWYVNPHTVRTSSAKVSSFDYAWAFSDLVPA